MASSLAILGQFGLRCNPQQVGGMQAIGIGTASS
jgi:hypothetical protein